MQSSFLKANRMSGLAILLSVGLLGAACTSSNSDPVGGTGGSSGNGSGSGGSSGSRTGGSTGSGGSSNSGTGGSASGSGGSASGSGGSSSGSGGSASGSGGRGGSSGGGSGGSSGGTDARTDMTSSGGDMASAGSGICAGKATRPLTVPKVDDFEASAISPAWSTFADITPPNSIKLASVMPGAVTTAKAARYNGTGAKLATAGGYGVGAVYNLAIDPGGGFYCVDISAYDGISFWAKAGKAGAIISINFVLPETNKKSMDSQGRPNGGDCEQLCYIHPQKNVQLTTEWAQYTVRFDQALGSTVEVRDRIQQIAILSPEADWDFTIDEIAFYKGTPPPGKVGQ